MKQILGIDEVGRGPWAGPLVVGAVILGEEQDFWAELKDSKKLSAKKREELNEIILEKAPATGIGWVKPQEIDKYGLGSALKLAARRAVKQVLTTKVPFDEIIIDGTINLLDNTPLCDHVTLLKKADDLVKEVSAASIIAKVARDNYMYELENKYPGYGFASHVGYGTAKHQQALRSLGICPEHRLSFRPVAKIAEEFSAEPGSNISKSKPKTKVAQENSTCKGKSAESAVADFLEEKGHTIITRNFRTKDAEIDIISKLDTTLYFTEVKYYQNSQSLDPLEQINHQKLQQMQYACQVFLKRNPEFANYQPILAAASVRGKDYRVENWFAIDE